MNRTIRKTAFRFFCVVSALILVGCAAVPKTTLDQAATKDVKKVALLPIVDSKRISVTNTGGPAMLLGAIGGAIQASVNEDHGKTYFAAINAQDLKMADSLSNALFEGLQKKGLDVVLLTDQHPKVAADGKSDDYSDIKTDADVILQVWFGYTGYFSGVTGGYKPWTVVHAKLLDAHTKKELYRQSFSAWHQPVQNTIEFIALDGNFEYGSFDELMAHAKESVDPLLQGHQAIARQLLQELKLGADGKVASSSTGTPQ